jgi:hypothetical protein
MDLSQVVEQLKEITHCLDAMTVFLFGIFVVLLFMLMVKKMGK